MNENCVFCKIIAGKIPAEKVYEDENILAFLDITPINIGHTLVVPKRHSENIYAILEEDFSEIAVVVKKIASAIKKGLGADGVNLIMNNDRPAGQLVFHTHIHVIPRFDNDGYEPWHGKKGIPNEEFVKTAEKIKSLL